MPMSIAIENVIAPRHLSVSGLDAARQQTTIPVTMEVYTGVVLPIPGSGFYGLKTVFRDEVRTFLPFEAMRVKAYSQVSFSDVTVMASVAAHRGQGDDVIAAVDKVVSVKLEQQSFPGVPGRQMCLAAMHANIYRYTYQVTLLVDAGAEIKEL